MKNRPKCQLIFSDNYYLLFFLFFFLKVIWLWLQQTFVWKKIYVNIACFVFRSNNNSLSLNDIKVSK